MISICIPVFNFNITSLIDELSMQIHVCKIQAEIIIIDDGSDSFKDINKVAGEKYTYVELPQNIGRACVRNLFLSYAKYDYLLFLDCDSLIKSSSFLANYVDSIKALPAVVCGGRVYERNPPKRERRLRWRYGISRESQPCDARSQFPYRSFMTNNFLIQKTIFADNKFEERVVKYGHEDTLLGYALKKKGIPITHIDNPVVNGEIELNSVFLDKTEMAVANLVNILTFTNWDKDLMENITLLRWYNKLNGIKQFVYFSFFILEPPVVFLLKRGIVSLYLFDYYKLGLLTKKIRYSSKSKT